MPGIALFPVFLVGLLGSVHCAAMCGGIVGALSVGGVRPSLPAAPAFPVPVRTVTATNVAAYNTGRIASYMAAGALAGGASGFAALPGLQEAAYWAANLMLVALGLFLMDAWRGLARLEQGGQALWRHVRPLLRRLGPPSTPGRMLAAGALWGWLPCGMVYSVLVTAMLSGSALDGAAVMLAFGLGTLPMLAALGLAGQRLHGLLRMRRVRLLCGLAVAGFGLAGLARAAGGLPESWVHLVCVGARSAA